MTTDDERRPERSSTDAQREGTGGRRAYAPPRLTEYGPLAKLTQSGAFTANGDAGQMMMT